MSAPTNTDLAGLIREGLADTRSLRSEVKQEFREVHNKMNTMNGKIQALDVFKAVQEDRDKRRGSAAIDWNGIIKQGLIATTVALTILLTVIQATTGVIKL